MSRFCIGRETAVPEVVSLMEQTGYNEVVGPS